MSALINAVNILFWILHGLLLVRILLSWFPGAGGQLADLVFRLTEPILAPIRAVIRRSPLGGPGMMIDFSPIFAFLLLQFLQRIIVGWLWALL